MSTRLGIDVVANLTDPLGHETVTEAALTASKHVYSQKPLARPVRRGPGDASRSGQARRRRRC